MPPFFILLHVIKKLIPGLLLCGFFIPWCVSTATENTSIIENYLAFSYDELTLPTNEAMGLVGGNYLFAINKHWYSGLGVYGAVKGKRGGFFTGGLDAGWRYTIYQQFYLDINGFVGGGGGGSAPQGGGLMLRAAMQAGIKIKQNSVGLGYSFVDFPNGNISSSQISINYRHVFKSFHFSGWHIDNSTHTQWRALFHKKSFARSNQFSLQLSNYFPHKSLARSGRSFDKHLDILGVRWRSNISSKFWLEFETGGAMLGNIDGFAQVFTGLSYENYFTRLIYWNAGVLVGAAGGGDVNTDGGLVYRSFAGLGLRFNPQWSVSSQLGWTSALEGNFSAISSLFNIVYHYDSAIPRKADRLFEPVPQFKNIDWQRFRIRPGFQRYSHFKGAGRKGGSKDNIDVDMFNLKLDSFINSHFYLTGQALGAFTGEAGGYAVGLVGPGYQINRFLGLELLGGVAGGGGIAVGSGQIIQPMFNFSWPLNESLELEASVGYIRAINDNLSAVATNLAVNYRFQTPNFK